MTSLDTKKVLVIGSGGDSLQQGGELDAAALDCLAALKKAGYYIIMIDDNPFSLTMDCHDLVDQEEIMPLESENIVSLIQDNHPDYILPTLGGRRAFHLLQAVIEAGSLTKHNVQLLGVPEATVRQVNNAVLLNQTLRKLDEPIKKIRTVDNIQDARLMVEEVGYPVIVRSVMPRMTSMRRIVNDDRELMDAVRNGIQLSQSGQVLVQQSLAGLREIEVEVIRDASGTMVCLGFAEDMDPIGIHAGDSMTVLPAQTLLDRQIQDMRNAAFAITRKLRIIGINHVQFAFDQLHNRFYVIKNSPYFDRIAAFVEQATGYPVARVCGHLYAGELMRNIRLDHGLIKHTAVTEPVMDRTAVRMPVFPLRDLDNGNQILNTQKKSIGSTIGVGRSLVEAVCRALTDAAIGHEDEIAHKVQALTDDQLDQLLIHPRGNRTITLIEAIRRGYSDQELTELTKINHYYFSQMRKLLNLIKELKQHPGDVGQLRKAKYWGLSDAWIAYSWQTKVGAVRELRQHEQINRTFKEVDPSAGQYDQHTGSFYSTFEQESESKQLSDNTALVIGTGARQLGNGTANDYVLGSLMLELKRLGYLPVIVNDNPNSISLSTQLSSKRYLEPLEIETLADIIKVEQPAVIFVPSIFKRLVTYCQKLRGPRVVVMPVDDQADVVSSEPLLEFNALFDGQYSYQLGITAALQANHQISYRPVAKRYPTNLSPEDIAAVNRLGEEQLKLLEHPGLYQVLIQQLPHHEFKIRLCRPLPVTDVAFLTKALHLNLTAIAGRLTLHRFSGKLLTTSVQKDDKQPQQAAYYRALFPFRDLGIDDEQPTAAKVMGAQMQFV